MGAIGDASAHSRCRHPFLIPSTPPPSRQYKAIVLSTVLAQPPARAETHLMGGGSRGDVGVLGSTSVQSEIGFLASPKRFNVAVTRAKALVVVVGNPNVLAADACWKPLLIHCRDNGTYFGAPCPRVGIMGGDEEDGMNLLLAEIALSTLDGALGARTHDSIYPDEDCALESSYTEDQPWHVSLG